MNIPKAVEAIMAVTNVFLETIQEAGERGAPAGPMYAMAAAHGITLAQFEWVMNVLIDAGRITKRGHVYYAKETEQ